jgi:hypothetical protein
MSNPNFAPSSGTTDDEPGSAASLEAAFNAEPTEIVGYNGPTSEELNAKHDDQPLPDQEPATLETTPESNVGTEPTNEKTDVYTSTAERVARASASVVAVLEKLSAGVSARQETRAEKMENAKDTVIRIGSRALMRARKFGSPSFAQNMLTTVEVTTSIISGEMIRNKIGELAKEAQGRYAQRRANRAENRMRDEANADNDKFDEDKRAEAEETARQEAIVSERNVRIEAARQERLKAADAALERQVETRARKEAALARKANRKTRRQEVYSNVRDKSGELYGRAKAGAKRFGRAALKTFKRVTAAGGAAASAAVNATRQSWKESSHPAPSN